MDKRYVILWESSINGISCALGFRNRPVAEKIAAEMKAEDYKRVEILDLETMNVDPV